LGHPLLEPGECVRNDVEVGPPDTFLLVTGSNMSGKSTLLRAIGANVVLAGAGGPVCAVSLELPRVRLHTCMTVTDSLEDGVSRFMAELLRVRSIVRAAREPSVPALYLLDELLQGTNTAERRVAAQAILRHLLDAGAIGALTTHDLTLHEAPDLAPRARAWHFRESVEQGDGGTRLHFDYLLRSGLATTRNALKLLEAVGLGSERPAEADGG
jgi:DNA mismatch repair ATPase MutS